MLLAIIVSYISKLKSYYNYWKEMSWTCNRETSMKLKEEEVDIYISCKKNYC